MTNNPPKKICLLHDMFLYRGGAERFNIMMAKVLDADLSALFFDPGSFHVRSMGFKWLLIPFGRNTAHKFFRQILLKWNLFFHTKFLQEYDTVIFSNDTLSAVRNARKDARKIHYAHSIPRYLFDHREYYYRKVPVLLRPLYTCLRAIWQWMYFREIAQIDEIYTNSKNLQTAIRKYLGRESSVIHPPVDTDVFVPLTSPHHNPLPLGEGVNSPSVKKGWHSENDGADTIATLTRGDERSEGGFWYKDYYISFSKLSTIKRVGKTVEAFAGMPKKKLLVIYGENDPQKDEIISSASGAENIAFLILEDNNDLPKHIAWAIATIFIAENEDFGMVALESMACGVPVIGIDEGGIKETVIDGKTGILLPSQFTIPDLQNAVREMTSEKSKTMHEACRIRALEFSHKEFERVVRERFL